MMIDCPSCNKREWGEPRGFNMMFKTSVGALDDGSGTVYLRPETAGGMFVNFKNVLDSLHPSLPFGLGQIGKAFRNEINPRDFIFRSREFEQMEIEYFVRENTWEEHFDKWRLAIWDFIKAVGIVPERVSELPVEGDDLAHYSKRTIDFEFEYPFGKKELYGLAYRTDFDLKAHSDTSTKPLTYAEEGEEPFHPHVIEPSFGVDRTVLAVLTSAYAEEGEGDEKRVYLKLAPMVAPIKAAVSPLLKNKPELVTKAREVYLALKKEVPQIMWDDNGNIGKRYRKQDEIGTPFCIVIDFDTLGEKPELTDTVTLRHRDTGEQERLSISDAIARVKDATVLR
jgi:glycyl-tRNA synthetase